MIFTVPPTFTNRPTNVYAHEKHDVTLSCQAAGNPPPKTSWLKNGKPLIPDDYFQLVESKNLKILGLLLSDNGYYQCVAENTVGSIQATIQLQVLEQGWYSLNVTINWFKYYLANILHNHTISNYQQFYTNYLRFTNQYFS